MLWPVVTSPNIGLNKLGPAEDAPWALSIFTSDVSCANVLCSESEEPAVLFTVHRLLFNKSCFKNSTPIPEDFFE